MNLLFRCSSSDVQMGRVDALANSTKSDTASGENSLNYWNMKTEVKERMKVVR